MRCLILGLSVVVSSSGALAATTIVHVDRARLEGKPLHAQVNELAGSGARIENVETQGREFRLRPTPMNGSTDAHGVIAELFTHRLGDDDAIETTRYVVGSAVAKVASAERSVIHVTDNPLFDGEQLARVRRVATELGLTYGEVTDVGRDRSEAVREMVVSGPAEALERFHARVLKPGVADRAP